MAGIPTFTSVGVFWTPKCLGMANYVIATSVTLVGAFTRSQIRSYRMAEICLGTLVYPRGCFYWTQDGLWTYEKCHVTLGYHCGGFYWTPNVLLLAKKYPNTLSYLNRGHRMA